MLRLLLLSAFALPVFAQTIPAPCRIEGRVLSAATGAPLKRATLRTELRGHVPPGYTVNDPTDFETTSDAEGRFVFDAIPPSRFYFLTAERPGYLSYEPDRMFDCTDSAGENVNLVIKLIPQAVISGRVVNDDGEPVTGAEVEVLRRIFVNGSRRVNQIDTESTHADGGFSIGGLKPGRYYVRASHRRESRPSAPGRKAAHTEALVPTYFPAAYDLATATPIDVAAGAQLSGIDIRLRTSPAFRVSGRVVTPASKNPLGQMELALIPKDFPPAIPTAQVEDWAFEFRDVLPGAYVLRPDSDGQDVPLAGSTSVTVRDEDIHDVILTLNPHVEVKATVALDEGDVAQLPRNLQPTFLFASDTLRHPGRNWAPNKEGRFVAELMPVHYTLILFTPGYLKSIRLNGQDVAADAIDLSGPSTLDIIVSMNGAHLDAVVRDADGQVAPKAFLQACDSSGKCTIGQRDSFAPGEYRVCAWAGDGDGIISIPQFRSAFDAQCTKIKLSEKAQESVELKLITKGAMDAEAAKMP
jgi:Carboxypeptidase regulatory-like domain